MFFHKQMFFSKVQLDFWQIFPRIQNMRNMKRKQVTDQRREKSIIKLFGLHWYFCIKWKEKEFSLLSICFIYLLEHKN